MNYKEAEYLDGGEWILSYVAPGTWPGERNKIVSNSAPGYCVVYVDKHVLASQRNLMTSARGLFMYSMIKVIRSSETSVAIRIHSVATRHSVILSALYTLS